MGREQKGDIMKRRVQMTVLTLFVCVGLIGCMSACMYWPTGDTPPASNTEYADQTDALNSSDRPGDNVPSGGTNSQIFPAYEDSYSVKPCRSLVDEHGTGDIYTQTYCIAEIAQFPIMQLQYPVNYIAAEGSTISFASQYTRAESTLITRGIETCIIMTQGTRYSETNSTTIQGGISQTLEREITVPVNGVEVGVGSTLGITLDVTEYHSATAENISRQTDAVSQFLSSGQINSNASGSSIGSTYSNLPTAFYHFVLTGRALVYETVEYNMKEKTVVIRYTVEYEPQATAILWSNDATPRKPAYKDCALTDEEIASACKMSQEQTVVVTLVNCGSRVTREAKIGKPYSDILDSTPQLSATITFDGWYIEGTDTRVNGTDAVTNTTPHTLVARWKYTYSHSNKKVIDADGIFGLNCRNGETLDLSLLQAYFTADYDFVFTISANYTEEGPAPVGSGTQEIYLFNQDKYQTSSKVTYEEARALGWLGGAEQDPGGNSREDDVSFRFDVQVDGTQMESLMYIRYDAYGGKDEILGGRNGWILNSITVTVTMQAHS